MNLLTVIVYAGDTHKSRIQLKVSSNMLTK